MSSAGALTPFPKAFQPSPDPRQPPGRPTSAVQARLFSDNNHTAASSGFTASKRGLSARTPNTAVCAPGALGSSVKRAGLGARGVSSSNAASASQNQFHFDDIEGSGLEITVSYVCSAPHPTRPNAVHYYFTNHPAVKHQFHGVVAVIDSNADVSGRELYDVESGDALRKQDAGTVGSVTEIRHMRDAWQRGLDAVGRNDHRDDDSNANTSTLSAGVRSSHSVLLAHLHAIQDYATSVLVIKLSTTDPVAQDLADLEMQLKLSPVDEKNRKLTPFDVLPTADLVSILPVVALCPTMRFLEVRAGEFHGTSLDCIGVKHYDLLQRRMSELGAADRDKRRKAREAERRAALVKEGKTAQEIEWALEDSANDKTSVDGEEEEDPADDTHDGILLAPASRVIQAEVSDVLSTVDHDSAIYRGLVPRKDQSVVLAKSFVGAPGEGAGIGGIAFGVDKSQDEAKENTGTAMYEVNSSAARGLDYAKRLSESSLLALVDTVRLWIRAATAAASPQFNWNRVGADTPRMKLMLEQAMPKGARRFLMMHPKGEATVAAKEDDTAAEEGSNASGSTPDAATQKEQDKKNNKKGGKQKQQRIQSLNTTEDDEIDLSNPEGDVVLAMRVLLKDAGVIRKKPKLVFPPLLTNIYDMFKWGSEGQPFFGKRMRKAHFVMSEELITFDGSCAVLPRAVAQARRDLEDKSQEDPVAFQHMAQRYLLDARTVVCQKLDVDPADCFLSGSLHEGMATILESQTWVPGDTLMLVEVAQVPSPWRGMATMLQARRGVSFIVLNLPQNVTYQAAVLAARRSIQQHRPQVAIFPQLSPVGERLPVEQFVRWAEYYECVSIVDGTNMIGNDPDLKIRETDSDYYIGNLDTFFYAYPGVTLVAVLNKLRQHIVSPLNSCSPEPSFATEWLQNTTNHCLPMVSALFGVQFVRNICRGNHHSSKYGIKTAKQAHKYLSTLLKVPPLVDHVSGSIIAVAIPKTRGMGSADAERFEHLLDYHFQLKVKVFSAVIGHSSMLVMQLTFRVFNTEEDVKELGAAVVRLLGKKFNDDFAPGLQ